MHDSQAEHALSWIRLIDPTVKMDSEMVHDLVSDWKPLSLKSISTGVLSMGRQLDRMDRAMKLIADTELRLKNLREEIGISRKAPPDRLPRVSCLCFESDGWISQGRWLPDILDRAAAFDPFHASTQEDVPLNEQKFASGRLDHAIILGETDSHIWPFPQAQTHRIRFASNWLSSSPDVFEAIFEAASLIHDRPDLF